MMSLLPVSSPSVTPTAASPSPGASATLTDDAALEILNRRFAEFDVAKNDDDVDGYVSRGDLQAVEDNSSDQELVDAASHLLASDRLLDGIDTAAEGGSTDDVVSRKDLTSYMLRQQPSSLPSLGTQTVTGSNQDPTILNIDAQAPDDASWGNRDGTQAGLVSVYVDGKYFADATIFAENPNGASVNLGVLGDGPHTIELRDSTRVGTTADSGIDPSTVSTSTEQLDTSPVREQDYATPEQYQQALQARDEALAAKYAPHLGLAADQSTGEQHSQATDNAPLLTTAQVINHEDGSTTIAYRILYSNEDGGDGNESDKLANRWGRTTDDERIYEVTVDADGNVIDFSGKNGGGHELSDDDKGVREMRDARGQGGLPGLSITNDHNNVRWDTDQKGRAYSGAPIVVDGVGPNTGRDKSNEPGVATNRVMAERENDWTWDVANAELEREGKTLEQGSDHGVDPYARLYLSTGEGTFDADAQVTVTYDDGSSETLRLSDVSGKDTNAVSVVIDSDGRQVASVEIVGAGGGDVEAYTLEPGTGDPRHHSVTER